VVAEERSIVDRAEDELVVIKALSEVLANLRTEGLGRNTLGAIGMVIKEKAEKLYEYVREVARWEKA